ncbi:MAG: sigma-54 dependent transcriptional regulator [Gemmatimonadota bacterium]
MGDANPGMLERTAAGTWSDQGSPVEVDPKDKETIRILVVDDERTLRESCASILGAEGFPVTVTGKADEALQILRRSRPEIVLVDLYMPEISGMDLLQEALKHNPDALVIVMTGKASVESSIQALRAGAWSYIPKPFSATHLSILIGRAAHAIMIGRESKQQRAEEESSGGHSDKITLLGVSAAFNRVIQSARQVAHTDASVFISGESGTGKEMIAQFIHHNSRRSSREMVSINSAAIPENLLESEMFGHVEGAFTGAIRDKKGLLEAANGGTLFLDEVNEMPHPIQAKLLRVIQDGVVRRVGSVSVDAVVDVRFIAATNQDPGDAVRSGKLRADLHYRLRVFPIEIPPLRERPEDIPVLARHYLEKFWKAHRPKEATAPEISDDAMAALQERPWHGNVRELRNVIEHTVVVLPQGARRVEADVLPFLEHDGPMHGTPSRLGGFPLGLGYHAARDHVLADFEKDYLRHVVRRANGNLSDAARFAGVDRTTLYRLMDKHDLRKEDLMRTDGG